MSVSGRIAIIRGDVDSDKHYHISLNPGSSGSEHPETTELRGSQVDLPQYTSSLVGRRNLMLSYRPPMD